MPDEEKKGAEKGGERRDEERGAVCMGEGATAIGQASHRIASHRIATRAQQWANEGRSAQIPWVVRGATKKLARAAAAGKEQKQIGLGQFSRVYLPNR